jgi:two-component system, NtrC family, sensor kinase
MTHSPLIDLETDDHTLEELMIADFERALGHLERRAIPPGTVLLEEGQAVDGIHIVLEGRVQLLRRADGGEVLLHDSSTGRIIGLTALARQREAFFTCRAATDVVALFVPFEDI